MISMTTLHPLRQGKWAVDASPFDDQLPCASYGDTVAFVIETFNVANNVRNIKLKLFENDTLCDDDLSSPTLNAVRSGNTNKFIARNILIKDEYYEKGGSELESQLKVEAWIDGTSTRRKLPASSSQYLKVRKHALLRQYEVQNNTSRPNNPNVMVGMEIIGKIPEPQIAQHTNPLRYYIDLNFTRIDSSRGLNRNEGQINVGYGGLQRVRYAQHPGSRVRVVFDCDPGARSEIEVHENGDRTAILMFIMSGSPQQSTSDAINRPIRHPNAVLYSRYYRRGGALHGGVDISGEPVGTSIYPIYPGTVVLSEWNDDYGWFVKIRNSSGPYSGQITTYGHMHERPGVTVNQQVGSNTVLGGVGSTGTSSGPHLHIDIGPILWTPRDQRVNIDHLFLNLYTPQY